MLDLHSPVWRTLKVPSGDGGKLPELIEAFHQDPCMENFDRFFEELVGEGDFAIHDSFFAALPHLVAITGQLKEDNSGQVLAQLGWGIALCGEETVPEPCAQDFRIAALEVGEMAARRLKAGEPGELRDWLRAAVMASQGNHEQALSLIDEL